MTTKSSKKYDDQEYKLKCHLKQKIASEILPTHAKEKEQLKNLVAECVEFGTSNSVLMLGLPGQGVSFLVDNVLEEFEDNITVVKLSGLLHINDHLALKHIIQQLHIDLLEEDKVTGSFFDNLGFVLQSLKSSNRNEVKPLIIVLDQLEYFTHHKNQTLLYNLFDVVQSHQTAICVIAITKRIDALELLEKRVKSRFSPTEIYLANDISYDLNMLRASMKSRYAEEWNVSIDQLQANNTVKVTFKTLAAHSKSMRLYKQFMMCLTDKISPLHRFLTEADFKQTLGLFFPNEKVDILLNLSSLELCLVCKT
uniref:Origin recognition complex subunit 4 n=1 Tax=Cacopsylla melanoneura TaxID=428564 RepID=A0A8D8VPJ9_9HEMI